MTLKLYLPFKTFSEDGLKLLKEVFQVEIGKRPRTKEELIALFKDYDCVIIGAREEVTKDMVKDCRLKVLGVLGYPSKVEVEELEKLGIKVFHTAGVNADAVAEHTLALILALAKNIVSLDKCVRNKDWSNRLSTFEVKGKILGLIGAGPIATKVAELARCLGMKVYFWTPHPSKHKDMPAKYLPLDELLGASDFISLHLALVKETQNFFNADKIAKMKDGSYFINTSRGELVDEPALISALKSGKLKGAALDVFKNEPNMNEEFLSLGNVILTPHVAGLAEEAREKMDLHLAREIVNYVKINL